MCETVANQSLEDRMRSNEDSQRPFLLKRVPVIVRVDGKKFSSYTRKHCSKEVPYDPLLINIMDILMVDLAKEIPGCIFAYTQSDEVSLLLHGYKNIHQEPWFNNDKDKITSVTASKVTRIFNHYARGIGWEDAEFDCKVRSYPENEVVNCFVWRQNDWVRNSVWTQARFLVGPKLLEGKKRDEQLAICAQNGVNWHELPERIKYGRSIARIDREWVLDPINGSFKSQNARNFIEELLVTDESRTGQQHQMVLGPV